MLEKINILLKEISSIPATGSKDAELFRLKYLSKKGLINELFNEFRKVSPAEKKDIGIRLNDLYRHLIWYLSRMI